MERLCDFCEATLDDNLLYFLQAAQMVKDGRAKTLKHAAREISTHKNEKIRTVEGRIYDGRHRAIKKPIIDQERLNIAFRSRSEIQKGENNSNWKGDKACRAAGHARAIVRFQSSLTCEECGINGRTERHHKDDNTLNNSRENIQFVCRKCHMLLDGRLNKMEAIGRKGREANNMGRGERNSHAKLTEKQVVEIRSSNESPSILGKRYGISSSHIYSIREGRAWRHTLDLDRLVAQGTLEREERDG